MANVRWKDKADIATLAAGDQIPVTDISAANADKYFTPAEMATYVWLVGGTLGAKLTAGAIEIEGSAFDINGGAIDAVAIGANAVATYCAVDNLLLDGNTLSSTDANGDITLDPNGTGDINLTTAGGNVIIPVEDLMIGAVAVLTTGTELNYLDGTGSLVAGLNESLARVTTEVTGNLSPTEGGFYNVDTSGGNLVITLPAIDKTKAGMEILVSIHTAGNNCRINKDAADAGFVLCTGDNTQVQSTQIDMSTVDDFVLLRSSGIETGYWMIVGGNGVDTS